jgi:hypothetical protein
VAIEPRKVGKKLLIDLDELQFMPKLVVDGQNVGFAHGQPIAKERGKNKYFSYEGVFKAIEKIYRCGYAPKIVIPAKFIYGKKIQKKTKDLDTLGRVKYFNKHDVLVPVNGEWDEQSKKDDVYALYYAFQTNSQIISNDKYRKELEEFGENEPGVWDNWLANNRLEFYFDEKGQFVVEGLIDDYKNPASYGELKRQSGLLKYWEEFEASMNRTAYEFAHWSDLI